MRNLLTPVTHMVRWLISPFIGVMLVECYRCGKHLGYGHKLNLLNSFTLCRECRDKTTHKGGR